MANQKGRPKTGGRVKGTPNKNSLGLADLLSEYNYDPVSSILKKYDKLSVEDQLKVDVKLLDFIYPRRKSVELDVAAKEPNPYKEMSLEELRTEHARLLKANTQTLISIEKHQYKKLD